MRKAKVWQPVMTEEAPAVETHKFEVHTIGVGCTVVTKHYLLVDAQNEAAFQRRCGKRAEVVTC